MFSPRTFTIQLCWILSLIVPLVSGVGFLEFGFPLGFRPEEHTRPQFEPNNVESRTGENSRGSIGQNFRTTSSAADESPFRAQSSTRAISTISQALRPSSSVLTIRTTAAVSNTLAMGTVSSSVAAQISSAALPMRSAALPVTSAALPTITTTRAAPAITTTSVLSSAIASASSAIAQQDTNEQATGQSALAPSPTASQVGLPDAVPFPASAKEGLTPMGQLGVTFGILAIAAGVAIWIWYRRRHPRISIGTSETKDMGGTSGSNPFTSFIAFTGYFKRKKTKHINDDQEWSIESAERVSIVKNMQAQSVSTVTRSNSKSSDRLGGDEESGKAMKEGRTNGLALNPITPKSAVFPMPPTSSDVERMQEKPVEVRPSDWPLNR